MIDSHVHLFPPEITGERERYLEDQAFSMIYGQGATMASAVDVVDHMNRWSIDMSIAMGFPFEREDFCRVQNDGLIAAAGAFPGSILPFASISPLCRDPRAAVGEIREMGFAGVGEIAFYRTALGADRENWLDGLLTGAEEMSLPVCFHVNEPLGHGYTGKYMTDFSLLYRVIERHQGVTIILSHWGGGILFYELMPEVRRAFGRVYYDTAASPYLYTAQVYTAALAIAGSRKILFGTDYPLLEAGRYLKSIRGLEIAGPDMENILNGNALRITGKG